MMVESSPVWMGMDLLVSKDEKESLSAIMWFGINQECFGLRSAFHEGMTFFMLWFPILVISPLKALRNIDVIPLKERGCFIKLFLHADMFRVKTIPVVRTPDSFFPIVPFSFLPWTGRFIMLLIFKSRLWSIKFSFLIFLLLSFTLHIFGPRDMEGLITGRSNDTHLDKLVMFTS